MSEAILEISDILNYLIKKTCISESELARKVNLPRATINRLTSGKTPDPRASTLNAIAEYFDISLDQLLGKQPLSELNNAHPYSDISIPVLSWEEAKIWEKRSNKSIYQDWITINPLTETGKFALKVNGDAMTPKFSENTLLIIDPDKVPKNRDYVIAFIRKTDEILFRQLIIDGNHKILKPINEIFPCITMEKNDILIGTVTQGRIIF